MANNGSRRGGGYDGSLFTPSVEELEDVMEIRATPAIMILMKGLLDLHLARRARISAARSRRARATISRRID